MFDASLQEWSKQRDPERICLWYPYDLRSMGEPGDPIVMNNYIQPRVPYYKFLSTGSLIDAKEALDDGFTVITHGWFTNSGYVN